MIFLLLAVVAFLPPLVGILVGYTWGGLVENSRGARLAGAFIGGVLGFLASVALFYFTMAPF